MNGQGGKTFPAVQRCLRTLQEAKQVNTLLYCMGEEAEDILTSTNPTADEKAVYNSVLEKFDEFFKVRKNIIFERERFNRRNQLDGETAEQYINSPYYINWQRTVNI
jgi:hypothetical protein